MKVKFIGNPAKDEDGKPVDDVKFCEAFGKQFLIGHAVDVSDLPEAARKKLAGNSHFEVVTETVETEKPAKKVKPPKQADADDQDAG